ncbi:MAG: type IV toxin-antitoxin system AbiEi family antitoxin domain-containing protein [Flavobacterium sp.]
MSTEDLGNILLEKHREWQLASRYSTINFINDLKKGSLYKYVLISLRDNNGTEISRIERFAKEPYSVFEIALSIKSNGYLSHYSAMLLNGLTEQIPKILYVTHELSAKTVKENSLTQENIDKAFLKPQREPSQYYEFEGYKVFLLNGKYSKKSGVIKIDSVFGKNLPVTNLERTLIDITVRPNYSGGIVEVYNAFKSSVDKISVNKLSAILTKLDFIYPYSQSIGFLLQKVGITKESQLTLMKKKDMLFDFYLSYDMKEVNYSAEWKLFYPKEL